MLQSVPPEVLDLDMLEVVSVDLHKAENSSAHHTDKFHHLGLVVRRGQAFTISITTNKALPKGEDHTFSVESPSLWNLLSLSTPAMAGPLFFQIMAHGRSHYFTVLG